MLPDEWGQIQRATGGGNVLTIDPGTADELDLQHSASGDTLTLSGSLDGSSFTAVFERI